MSRRQAARTLTWIVVGLGLLAIASGCDGFWSPTGGSLTDVGPMKTKVAQVRWRVPGDFATIQAAVDSPSVAAGDRIVVEAGSHAGALLTKSVDICGEGNAIISSGPPHSSGLVQGFRLLAGSDGASFSHLVFAVDLAIMNGAAIDSITISQCTFQNPVQAISNWSGCDWLIEHNLVEGLRCRNGGGIGILIGDRSGGSVTGNVIAHNTLRGVLTVPATDGGGYNGSGIVLYADFRYGWPGTEEISGNRVVHNLVALVSDTPEVVDVAAFELTDARDDPDLALVIFSNAIGFNDFRGTGLQIVLTPEELSSVNEISRNLGENRGHGAHPAVFGTGGD
jgi:hypothetical protein